MKKIICKGLTKLLIKESKDKELQFEKKQLEFIKSTAEVRLYKEENGWDLYIDSEYAEGSCGYPYYWKGRFTWDETKKEGQMKIFSGFSGNFISRVDNSYTCPRPNGTDYKNEFKFVLEYMKKARKGSLASMNCYREYVAATGDIS